MILANSSQYTRTDPSAGTTYSSSFSPTQQPPDAQRIATFSPSPVQMGTTSGATSSQTARHAFAGYGTLTSHYSWLLSGEHVQATALRTAIADILRQRNILALRLNEDRLQERGFWVEEREYLKMQRGVATIFIYVAPAGQDLYISRATTVIPSFEPIRIGLLILVLFEIFFGPSIFGSVMASIASSSAVGFGFNPQILLPFIAVAVIFGLLYVPSIIFLLSFLFASFKYWLAEKDFWVYLRRNTLNDFELDDIMLLEHATDETVLTSVKQLNLDASKIVPPAMGYQANRRIRLI